MLKFHTLSPIMILFRTIGGRFIKATFASSHDSPCRSCGRKPPGPWNSKPTFHSMSTFAPMARPGTRRSSDREPKRMMVTSRRGENFGVSKSRIGQQVSLGGLCAKGVGEPHMTKVGVSFLRVLLDGVSFRRFIGIGVKEPRHQ